MNKEIIDYVRERLSCDEIARAWEEIDKWRCPLSHADRRLYNKIDSLIDDFCLDNDIDRYDEDWENYDAENIFEEL